MKYPGLITQKVYIQLNMVIKRRGSLSVKKVLVNCTFLFFSRFSICQSRDTLPKQRKMINGALAYLKKKLFKICHNLGQSFSLFDHTVNILFCVYDNRFCFVNSYLYNKL